MANRTIAMNDDIHAYLVGVSVHETDVMRRLRDETRQMTSAGMQIGPEQGAFMAWLVGTLGAKRCLEVGTFTGYSALAVAGALPADGRLLCCDVSEEFTSVARRYWAEAGLAERIELRLGPAVDTLAALDDDGTWDFAFIDADKPNYDAYYEHCLRLLRPGGTIAIDNVLWGGAVADSAKQDESTRALRAINEKVGADPRVAACMVPIGDGLTLARKR
ncbi:MAG: class I SAM-dependent methyltransferase [Sandaracinaceae bacterium]|nr:class I SAM-dependent methyltransferase [Sandaracinaceae bacterium]